LQDANRQRQDRRNLKKAEDVENTVREERYKLQKLETADSKIEAFPVEEASISGTLPPSLHALIAQLQQCDY